MYGTKIHTQLKTYIFMKTKRMYQVKYYNVIVSKYVEMEGTLAFCNSVAITRHII